MSFAVIFANGTITDLERVRAALMEEKNLQIIAADGGVQHCLRLQITPDLVIGDLDSINETLRAELKDKGVRFKPYARDKDQTDLELALHFAVGQNPERIQLFGLLGGRLDQTIANLLLLARPEWGSTKLIALEGPETAYLLRGGETQRIRGEPGEIVSLIPLSPQVRGVTTQGLRWKLREADLSFGSTLGISNELEKSTAKVAASDGVMLVIHRSTT